MTPKNLRLTIHTAVVALLVAAGCGKSSGTGADSGGGANGVSGDGTASSLLGSWIGTYGDISTTSATLVDPHHASASFASDNSNNDDTSGNFNITINDIPNASVLGSFTRYNTGSTLGLTLTVTQTTITSIAGQPGMSAMLAYTLIGNSLTMKNDQIELILSPGTATATATATGTGTDTSPTPPAGTSNTYGRWNCTDNLGNQWAFNLQTNNTFTIDVVASGVQGDIQLDGNSVIVTGQGNKDTDSVLTVNQSNVAKYNGMVFRLFTGTSTTDMTVRRMNADGTTVNETFACTKSS